MGTPNDSLYPRTVFVRVSEHEKARIAARAKACGVSESRLLARLGTEGAAPPTLDEREDLRVVRLMLSQLVTTLKALAAETKAAPREGENPLAEVEILSAVRTAHSLLRSLRRRLRL